MFFTAMFIVSWLPASVPSSKANRTALDQVLQAALGVGSVGQPAEVHRVGHQGHLVGPRSGRDQAERRRVNVDQVGDQFHCRSESTSRRRLSLAGDGGSRSSRKEVGEVPDPGVVALRICS